MAGGERLPINFLELLNLQSLGIHHESIRFENLTMESDKYICLKEGGNIVIVDMASGNRITKHPINADSAIMNPASKVIALRAGTAVKILDLAMEATVKQHKFPDGQEAVYWCWLSKTMLAIVTATSVYHWSMDGGSNPQKIFDRNSALGASKIISYKISADGKWCALVGIARSAAGGVSGVAQLYSVAMGKTQIVGAHAVAFAQVALKKGDEPSCCFCFAEKKDGAAPTLTIIEVGKDPSKGAPFRLAPQAIPFPPDAGNDFPVTLSASTKHPILFLITKFGFLYLFDVATGNVLFRKRVSLETIFVTCSHESTGGVLGVTARKGQVLSFSLNEDNLVPYVMETLKNTGLALQLAVRMDLPGADPIFMKRFDELLGAGQLEAAMTLAIESPRGILRTPDTLRKFQSIPPTPGQPPVILQYFHTLLAKAKLNEIESIELTRPVLEKGKLNLVEGWLKEDKITCSEMLGDMVLRHDPKMALSIYLRAKANEKVVQAFLQLKQYDKIVAYAASVGYNPDFVYMIQQLVRVDPKGAEELAKMLVNHASGPLVDTTAAMNAFMGMGRIQECTAFLLEALKGDKPEEADLQTRLLEINLQGGAAAVADAILSSKMFSHFDKVKVGQYCERAQLFQRAIELYSDPEDIKRVLRNTHAITPEFLLTYFGSIEGELGISLIESMIQANPRNIQVAVALGKQHTDRLGAENLIALFEKAKSWEGMFYFLGGIVNTSTVPLVHYKFIEAAIHMSQFPEVERVCRDSTVYDADEVMQLLIDNKLPDPRPLIHVCDRHDKIEKLTAYLYNNNLMKYIEVYVTKVSPTKTPMVVAKLLDLDCNEDFIKNLLNEVRHMCPIQPLVEVCEERNRLRLLQPFLEARIAEGNVEPATHNAIGKIFISLNKEPQAFLLQNQFYESKVVGKFCEKLDPYLAYLAYRRAWGACDEELIEVTNKNDLFKDQARYLVERQEPLLWQRVLSDDNDFKRKVIDEVVNTALPESKNPDEVSNTVKAFMEASLPGELIGLLERLVLQGSDFSENKNLQNLLIITAITSAQDKVMDYINRLDRFEGPDIAKIAIGSNLYEEAFVIYKKCEMHVEAIDVLLYNIHEIDRAVTFADRINTSEVWSKLANAQLESGLVSDAIDSFIKAADPSIFPAVIEAAEGEGSFVELVKFLRMARENGMKDSRIDTELVYSLAQIGELGDLEEFITNPNIAQIQGVGDRLYEETKYEAALLCYQNISNNAKVASCYVNLGKFREACEAAKKANSVRVWKLINKAAVDAGEFKLAQQAGLNIIVAPDHLEELVEVYEKRGFFTELISLMESGLGMEAAHPGMFTELGVLYSKYKEEALMDHIKVYGGRMHIPKLLRACESGKHWKECVHLNMENEDFDMACSTMIDHSPVAFENDKFMEAITKVRNQELYYRAIDFYLAEQPMVLNNLLKILVSNLDHSRVVHQINRTENLPLVLPYLKIVQTGNISAVNEAINDIYIEEEYYDELRSSIDEFDNFDQIGTAQKLEKHELLEMRRIAAYIYKNNKRYAQSVALSKADSMFKDAIDCCSDSGDTKIAEELLEFFVAANDKECFCATLYTCYELIRADVALELAYRHGLVDFVMPYMIQYLREMSDKVKEIDERTAKKKDDAAGVDPATDPAYGGFAAPLQLASTAYNADPTAGYAAAGYGAPAGMAAGYGGEGAAYGAMNGGFPAAPMPGMPPAGGGGMW